MFWYIFLQLFAFASRKGNMSAEKETQCAYYMCSVRWATAAMMSTMTAKPSRVLTERQRSRGGQMCWNCSLLADPQLRSHTFYSSSLVVVHSHSNRFLVSHSMQCVCWARYRIGSLCALYISSPNIFFRYRQALFERQLTKVTMTHFFRIASFYASFVNSFYEFFELDDDLQEKKTLHQTELSNLSHKIESY